MDYIVCELHSIILVLIKLVKDSLRIPMGIPEAVNRRRTDSIMIKREMTKGQTMIYKSVHLSHVNCYYIWVISYACYYLFMINKAVPFPVVNWFVCLYTYEFWLSLCKIVRSSVIFVLPLFRNITEIVRSWRQFHNPQSYISLAATFHRHNRLEYIWR